MSKLIARCGALIAALLLLAPAPAFAQLSNAAVVAACGTPPATYSPGTTRQVTQDTAGNVCTDASATGTFTNPSAGTTGNAVPGSADFSGINVGGNLRGVTGVNPSGTVYAPQFDLASAGGVTLLKGNGVTGTGSPRVTIASDNTPFGITCAACATAAKQPALGTAGTPSTDVLTVQGADTGTPLPVVAGGNSFVNITTATTTTAKSGAGVLHTVCVNALGTVASSAVIYDNTAGSGTKIATLNTLALLGCQTYDVAFATGLTVVTTGTVAPDITLSLR